MISFQQEVFEFESKFGNVLLKYDATCLLISLLLIDR
jgi:hypothetical protein